MAPVEQRFLTGAREEDRDEPGLVLEDDGTVWLIAADGTRGQVTVGGGTSLLQTVTVPLSAAQLLDISNDVTTELIPAPGPGKMILPVRVTGVFRAGTAPSRISGNPVMIVGWEELEDETGYALFCFKELSPADYWGAGHDLGLTDSIIVFGGSDAPDGDFGGGTHGAADIAWFEDQPLTACWKGNPLQIPGAITASAPAGGGFDYAIGDTGTILGGDTPATYVVDSLGENNGVATYTLTSPGDGFTTGVHSSEVGGAQPGAGNGAFSINVAATDESGNPGDGTLHLIIGYRTLDLPA